MANPTLKWDQMPVYGWWEDEGDILLTVPQRIRRQDGLMIYPGGKTVTVKIGDQTQQDPAARSEVRAAMRAKYAAANTMPDQAGPFDSTAWDVWWDGRLSRAIFTYFYLSDDPDITPNGWQVQVQEKLRSGTGKPYVIQTLAQFLEPGRVPGINLGTIEVPPGAPSIPAPVLAKGQPGGIAALSLNGFPMTSAGIELDPSNLSGTPGGSAIDSWADIESLPGTPTAFPTSSAQIGDATPEGRGLLTGSATAATLRDRGTHTGTQSADTIIDGTTNHAFTAADDTKLGGIAAGATANATDAQLRDRSTHTGTQTAATIADLTEAVQDIIGVAFSGGNVTASYNDAAGTITLTAPAGTTDPEVVRDAIGAAMIGAGLISVTVNDAGDTITISTTATTNSTDAQLRDRSTHTGTQAQSTITNLTTDLATKAPLASPTFTGTATAASLTVTGAVSLPDNSVAMADVNGLSAALTGKATYLAVGVTGSGRILVSNTSTPAGMQAGDVVIVVP